MTLGKGYSNRFIPSEADFNNLAIMYNILVVATLIPVGMIGQSKYMDSYNFEISKVTFHAAVLMAISYYCGCAFCILLGLDDELDVSFRSLKEKAMVCGFLTLAFVLMNLFGFFAGVMCLLVSPPFMFLVQQFLKFRNVKESQD
ncbi:hypothetical protein CARUB_v10018861mg [Capsella rubella]|uniref:Uncharacterized protein n=1 Tax=Capsella rubella TaxID=81985 RepID=R0FS11_9BRAS|nr:hypothetical protein CARUB_v10018861mg [Capsella rubella]